MKVEFKDTIPTKLLDVGQPLSTKTGFICKANIETKDGVKFRRGVIYSPEDMKKVPEDKRFKFVQAGKPSVVTADQL